MTLKLLEDERSVLTSHQGALSVTSHRVVFSAVSSGASQYTSIPLDQVASCGLVTTTHPLLLVLAAGALIAGFASDEAMRVTLLTAGVLFVIAYFVTRQAVLKICSTGGEAIVVPTKGVERDVLLTIPNAIDAQIARRASASRS